LVGTLHNFAGLDIKANKAGIRGVISKTAKTHSCWPDSLWSYHMLAQTSEASGQIDKAIADYRKVLELPPTDDWTEQQVAVLSRSR
jgi:predicted TPR repeat methyltransferase